MLENRSFNPSFRAVLIISILLALALRIGYALVAVRVDPVLRGNPLYGDASGYHLLATHLLELHSLTWDGLTPTTYRMPGYPAFLMLIYAISSSSQQAVRLVQAVFGALVLIPVLALTRRLDDWRVWMLVGFGVALHPLLLYMTGWIYTETVYITILWFGIWLLVIMVETSRLVWAILAGVLLGAATYLRPEIALFPAFLLCVAVLWRWSPRSIFLILIVQATLVILLLPWAVRNTRVNGAFVLLTTSGGSNLYAGNNPNSNGGSAWVFPEENMSELESDRLLGNQAKAWMFSHPAEAVRLLPRKLTKFFSPIEMETRNEVLGRITRPINIAYSLFLVLGVWGLVKKRNEKPAIVLAAVVGWYVLTMLVFYGGTRVALPTVPALIILGMCGLAALPVDIKSTANRWKPFYRLRPFASHENKRGA